MFPLNTSGRATINVKIEEPTGGRVVPKWEVSDNVRLEVRLWGKKGRPRKLTQTQGSWYCPKVKLVGPDPYICCIATVGSYLHSQSSILEAIRHPLWHMYTCLHDVKILHDTVQYLLRHLQPGMKKCYIYSKFSVCVQILRVNFDIVFTNSRTFTSDCTLQWAHSPKTLISAFLSKNVRCIWFDTELLKKIPPKFQFDMKIWNFYVEKFY